MMTIEEKHMQQHREFQARLAKREQEQAKKFTKHKTAQKQE
jgi:hypothetical protein